MYEFNYNSSGLPDCEKSNFVLRTKVLKNYYSSDSPELILNIPPAKQYAETGRVSPEPSYIVIADVLTVCVGEAVVATGSVFGQVRLAVPISVAQFEKEDEFEDIRKRYFISDCPGVKLYIEENPTLLEILIEASERIQTYFPGSPLSLKLNADPQGIDPDDLILAIETDMPSKEARARLKMLDHDWWLSKVHLAKHLIICLEYR